MSVGLFTLQSVDVKTVTGELEKLFGDKNLGPLAGAIRVVPIERLNALLVVTPQAKYLEQARTWIERLDRPGAGGGGQRLYVYPVQNGKAEIWPPCSTMLFREEYASQGGVFPRACARCHACRDQISGACPGQRKEVRPAASATSVAAGPEIVWACPGCARHRRQGQQRPADLASPADYESIESAIPSSMSRCPGSGRGHHRRNHPQG